MPVLPPAPRLFICGGLRYTALSPQTVPNSANVLTRMWGKGKSFQKKQHLSESSLWSLRLKPFGKLQERKCGFDFPDQPEAEHSPHPDSAGCSRASRQARGVPILRSGHWSRGTKSGTSPSGPRQNQNQLSELRWPRIKVIKERGQGMDFPHKWEARY